MQLIPIISHSYGVLFPPHGIPMGIGNPIPMVMSSFLASCGTGDIVVVVAVCSRHPGGGAGRVRRLFQPRLRRVGVRVREHVLVLGLLDGGDRRLSHARFRHLLLTARLLR